MKKKLKDAYHYTECGLDNIYLLDGYYIEESPYGEVVSFDNLSELHRLIGQSIIEDPNPLTAKEIKFLRTEMDMSQKRLGETLGRDGQSIGRWERNENKPDVTTDMMIRVIYKAFTLEDTGFKALIERLNELDRRKNKDQTFTIDPNDGWRKTG